MLQDIKVRSAPTLFSPTLMNMTLDGLEKLLREKYPSNTRRSRKAKVNMVRYADDMIITGSSPELLADEIKPLVEKFLRERGLEIRESAENHKDQQASQCWRVDSEAQPDYQRVGQLSSPRGEQAGLQSGGSGDLREFVAMGEKKACSQRQTMGGEEIFSTSQDRPMGVLRTSKRKRWSDPNGPSNESLRYAHPKAYQDQRRSQSV